MTAEQSPARREPVLPLPGTREARVRSRRILLYVLAFMLAVWVLMMLAMYFTTVYPRLHHHPPMPEGPTLPSGTPARTGL